MHLFHLISMMPFSLFSLIGHLNSRVSDGLRLKWFCSLALSFFSNALALSHSAFLQVLEVVVRSIDVCPTNGNLLASGGDEGLIKIYDRRESKVVQILGEGEYHTCQNLQLFSWNFWEVFLFNLSLNFNHHWILTR